MGLSYAIIKSWTKNLDKRGQNAYIPDLLLLTHSRSEIWPRAGRKPFGMLIVQIVFFCDKMTWHFVLRSSKKSGVLSPLH